MKHIVDLHIHSKYSRACSQDLTLPNLALWAVKKGITIIGTGDFTHPAWFKEIEENLIEEKSGLYQLRSAHPSSGLRPPSPTGGEGQDFEGFYTPLFMLTSEVASIYKQGDKVRRVHNLIFAPSVDSVRKLIVALEKRGVNLKADGRPIMGVPCPELLAMCKEVDPRIELVPAHAWTPHFGVFGSLSGFDTIEECYGDMAKHIFAIETGLSSDPAMNWRVPMLDHLALISNSDAHSLRKLGREANVMEIADEDLSFDRVIQIIKKHDPKEFLSTIEFFPEEGKYHLDGHADCKIAWEPETTKQNDGRCPVCGKKLLLGVMHRVDDLASGKKQSDIKRVPFTSAIPLEEIIAETFGVGTQSKKVLEQYEKLVAQIPEFTLLIDTPEPQLLPLAGSDITESIIRVRAGKVHIQPGYDGIFGKIQIYNEDEHPASRKKVKQVRLF